MRFSYTFHTTLINIKLVCLFYTENHFQASTSQESTPKTPGLKIWNHFLFSFPPNFTSLQSCWEKVGLTVLSVLLSAADDATTLLSCTSLMSHTHAHTLTNEKKKKPAPEVLNEKRTSRRRALENWTFPVLADGASGVLLGCGSQDTCRKRLHKFLAGTSTVKYRKQRFFYEE